MALTASMVPTRRMMRALRPVVLLVVFTFVLLPLTVYHFFTFDFQRVASLERKFLPALRTDVPRDIGVHSAGSEPLPYCLDIPSGEFLNSKTALRLRKQCGGGETSQTRTEWKRLAHFVHVPLDAVPRWEGEEEPPREEFTYLQFAAVQSLRRALNPEIMVLHYLEEPRGEWFSQCQRHLSMHQVLSPVSFEAMASAEPPHLSVYQRRQIMEILLMLRALRKQGGVAFSDFKTFVLRPLAMEMESSLVVASHSRLMASGGGAARRDEDSDRSSARRRSRSPFGIGLHTLHAPPGHPFVAFLERRLTEMVLNNDPSLHEMLLEEVVGRLVVDEYLEQGGNNATTNEPPGNDSTTDANVSTDGSNIAPYGIAVGTSNLFEYGDVYELLSAEMADDPVSGRLHDVMAFHLCGYDVPSQSSDTTELQEILRMQEQLRSTEEWLEQNTLFGAILRLAVSANTSAELEPQLT